MTQPSSIAKEFSSSRGDRRVRVQVGNQQGKGFHALTVAEDEIQGVAEMGQNRSALVLRSGTEIPVALPYEQLEQKIYERDFRTDGPVLDLRDVTGEAARPKAPANTNTPPAPGDKMPDGTVFAGISPDTNKPMYATPADASFTMTFNEAADYAEKLNSERYLGHDDWRVPKKCELDVLFNNRAAIGELNLSGSRPAGWYWSATPRYADFPWCQNFRDGEQYQYGKDFHSSVRIVRSDP
jgi:hypothetical protein